MPQHGRMPVALGGDPVELNDAALALEWLVPMPRVVGPLESHERALDGRHLGDEIIKIITRAQEAQAAAGLLPGGVHVDEHRDYLCFRIRMDLAIAFAAASAHRGGGRTA